MVKALQPSGGGKQNPICCDKEMKARGGKAFNWFFVVARGIAVLATAAVAVWLAREAHWHQVKMLDLFWLGIVPLVPLTLLLAPHLWRNVCPLAVFSLAGARFGQHWREIRRARLPRKTAIWVKRYGVTLAACTLWLLVPMRLLLFNESAQATLVLILMIVLATLALGLFGSHKETWCSSLCPIYPVEKFYGSAPMWTFRDARCAPASLAQSCYRCALHCLDVPATDTRYWAAMERAGTARASEAFRRFFLASFPGFVLAYWLLSATEKFRSSFRGAPFLAVYGTFLLLMLGSYGSYRLAEFVISRRGSQRSPLAHRRLSLIMIALAINLYYGASSAGISTLLARLAGSSGEMSIIRAGILGIVFLTSLLWLSRAWSILTSPWTRW